MVYDGHNVLAPTRHYAHPFYSCAYNLAGDGHTDNPVYDAEECGNLLIGDMYRRMIDN